MATAVLSPCLNGDLLPITHREVEVRPKRRRVKNVTWQTEDKLCQVRMFSADDAPSTSGFMLHTPISSALVAKDLPPGFEGVMNKRFKLDAVSEKSMAVERPWRRPDKFVLDCAWLVVEGDESTEIISQQQREIRVLEAVYPRTSSVPLSPAEPHDICDEIDDSLVPYIPSVPVEDEDQVSKEGSSLGFSFSAIGEPEKSRSAYAQLDVKGVEEPSVGVQYGLVTANLVNADCSIATAVADTDATVMSLKDSSLVDHALLFEILSNPVLMKTLLSAGQTISKSIEESLIKISSKILANGKSIFNEEIKGNSCLAACLQPNTQGVFERDMVRQDVETSEGHTPVSIGEIASQSNSCSVVHNQDLPHMRTGYSIGAQGMTNLQVFERSSKDFDMKVQGVAPAILLEGQLSGFGGLAHKHRADSNNDQAIRGMKDMTSDPYVERQRMARVGSQSGLSSRGDGLPKSCIENHRRGDAALMFFPDVARTRPRKPCLYFNTPKGCRNGASCGFLHEAWIEN